MTGAALGLESGQVRVVAYDPRWPPLYRAEADRLLAAVAPLPLALEHIGSTAVPGLGAKPILDILAGYPEGGLPGEYVAALSKAGYVHRGEQGIPGREFFRRGDPRAYHVHLTRRGSSFWRDHLEFRDRLRAEASLRDAYDRLKRELAARFPTNREAYIDGKTGFVHGVLGRGPG